MVNSKQNKPYTVKIELTEGCTRLCNFCAVKSIYKTAGKKYFKFLRMDNAKLIAAQVSSFAPKAKIEFASQGEPTANPKHLKIISMLRAVLPTTQMQLTTNGNSFLGENLEEKCVELFKAGLDFIVCDTYLPERDELRSKASLVTKFKVVDFYDGDPGIYLNKGRRKQRFLCLLDDISLRDRENKKRNIHNWAGNVEGGEQLKKPLDKMCVRPFREFVIKRDGTVPLCCLDAGHDAVVGNVFETSMKDIWFGEKLNSFRKFLSNKKRLFSPCCRCNVGSGMRCGLCPKYSLPDKTAKELVRGVAMASQMRTGKKPVVLF